MKAPLRLHISFFSGKWFYLVAAFLLALTAGFSAFYLLSGYGYLVNWWTGLNDCFYESELWTQNFFTPEVKAKGNVLCALGCGLSVIGLVYSFNQFLKKRTYPALQVTVYHTDALLVFILMLCNFCLWLWGKSLVPAVGDEVRSALDSAAIHPFQTLSYYSLPNNHVLFNLMNNILFSFTGDKVFTGKLISLAAYLLLSVITYLWFRKITGNRFYAFIAALVLSLQFPVWGFSFQGRGYEWYAIMGWLAFIGLMQYLQKKQIAWLRLHAFCVVIGYALVPTFMYFHLAILMFGFFMQLVSKKFDLHFWKYQAFAFCGVFLFYLPALSFSGVGAFSESKYIKSEDISVWEFLKQPPWRYYIDYGFSWFEAKPTTLGLWLFILPLILFFSKGKNLQFKFALFYPLMVGGIVIIFMIMKRFTYHRTMIIQYSIMLSFIIYALFVVSNFLNTRVKYLSGYVFFGILMALLGTHIFLQNKEHGAIALYYSDMNEFYEDVTQGLNFFPDGSTIGFSAESYNWKYLAKDRPLIVSECINGHEDYLIKQEGEVYPSDKGYKLVNTVRDYEIYQKNTP